MEVSKKSGPEGRQMGAKARTWAINLALILVGVVVTEGVARIAGITPSSVDPSLPLELGAGKPAFGRAYPRGYFVPDEEHGFDIKPNFQSATFNFQDGEMDIFSNRFGCLDRNTTISSPYVMVLGDSFAWGYAAYESKWGTVLEQEIGTTVAKCGVTHSGQKYQLSKGRSVAAAVGAPPQLVVVSYYVNDPVDDLLYPQATVIEGYLTDQIRLIDGKVVKLEKAELEQRYKAWAAGGEAGANPGAPMGRPSLLRQSSVVASLVVRLARDAADRHSRKAVEALSTTANLEGVDGLKAWTDSIGARLLFLLIPPREMKHPYYSELKEHLDDKKIDYFDLYPPFKARPDSGKSLYYLADVHFTLEGNRVAGGLLAAEVKRRYPDLVKPSAERDKK